MPTNETYNGMPLFHVGESDFIAVVECAMIGSRFMAKNIVSTELKEFYTACRKPAFAVEYDGSIAVYGNSL